MNDSNSTLKKRLPKLRFDFAELIMSSLSRVIDDTGCTL
jgi:hypothetical protein